MQWVCVTNFMEVSYKWPIQYNDIVTVLTQQSKSHQQHQAKYFSSTGNIHVQTYVYTNQSIAKLVLEFYPQQNDLYTNGVDVQRTMFGVRSQRKVKSYYITALGSQVLVARTTKVKLGS